MKLPVDVSAILPWKEVLIVVIVLLQTIHALPLERLGKDSTRRADQSSHWVTVWGAMPQLVEPYNLPPPPYNGTSDVFFNTTIRQTVRIALDAPEIRVRLSNEFGEDPLEVTRVVVSFPQGGKAGTGARALGSAIDVTFGENSIIAIPPGSLAVSDPIALHIGAESVLMIDIYLATGQQNFLITGHPGSRTTSFLASGDQTGAQEATGNSVEQIDHWYFISAIEALLPPQAKSFVIIGDSITDGRGSTTNANDRWPDLLLDRMQKSPVTKDTAVVNQAAGGNRILLDGLGPSVMSRIDRDVLAQSGVSYTMIFEGVNDIGVASEDRISQENIGNQLIMAYQQIATRLHAAGLPFFGATITPFGSPSSSNYTQPYSSPEREKTRQRVNKFIRTSGIFDAVLDFDQVLRDPSDPTHLLAAYDSGDHLHPNEAGYQALADFFPLELFQ